RRGHRRHIRHPRPGPDIAEDFDHRATDSLLMRPRDAQYQLLMREAVRHALLLFIAAFAIVSLLWMISTSLKPPSEILSAQIRWWPDQFHALENYRDAFTTLPLARYLMNGAIVTAAIFSLQVLIALPAALRTGQDALLGSQRRLRRRVVLHPYSVSRDRHPPVPASPRRRTPQLVRGTRHSVHDFGLRYFPDAAVLHDRPG